MKKLYNFLNKLEQNSIYYKLDKIREDSIMVEVAIPGERWEIEFMSDDSFEIEKFKSNGEIFKEDELKVLFDSFSD